MTMDGYITEKIFDCLYAGTIPLYLGAPDISEIIPDNAYVDCRKFSSWHQMWDEICNMPENQIESMRQAGLDFLTSKNGLRFYNSLNDIFEID
ncbi:MAG: glycosyltransferase family 10 domain-containing protein, partial [Nitrosopumilaceae archaeon]